MLKNLFPYFCLFSLQFSRKAKVSTKVTTRSFAHTHIHTHTGCRATDTHGCGRLTLFWKDSNTHQQFQKDSYSLCILFSSAFIPDEVWEITPVATLLCNEHTQAPRAGTPPREDKAERSGRTLMCTLTGSLKEELRV